MGELKSQLAFDVGGDFEIDEITAKAAGFPGAEGDADEHPGGAGDLGGAAEAEPQQKADRKARQRRDAIADRLVLRPQEVADKRG